MSIDVGECLAAAEQLAAGSLQAYGQRNGAQHVAVLERLAAYLLQRAWQNAVGESAEVFERSTEQTLRCCGVFEVQLLQRLQRGEVLQVGVVQSACYGECLHRIGISHSLLHSSLKLSCLIHVYAALSHELCCRVALRLYVKRVGGEHHGIGGVSLERPTCESQHVDALLNRAVEVYIIYI